MNLHRLMMNLPMTGEPPNGSLAYRLGHRDARHAGAELALQADAINAQLLGALRLILAFYEPGQTCLDTNAWKQAEAAGRAAVRAAEGEA